MGFRGRVSRSTLADANEAHDWRIFADFAQVLIHIARPMYASESLGFDLDNTVYALDSTTIDLCLSVFPWARFRSQKAAIKMHTLLDLRGPIPTFIEVSDGKLPDVKILDAIVPEPGSFYVMDRAYVDFERLHVIHRSGAFFVTRTKKGILFRRRYSHDVDAATGVRSDHTVVPATADSRKHYPDPLRRVHYYDAEQDRRLRFLTNNFDLPAFTICLLYKSRWQVELFFESSTWCTPLDAMEFRGSIAPNCPLAGEMVDSVRPGIARRRLREESRVRPRRAATPAAVSAESAAEQLSA